MKFDKERFLPLLLTVLIILADQISKSVIAINWPIPPQEESVFPPKEESVFIKDVFNNDFLRIIHVRNKVIAFSLGKNLPENIRPVLFVLLPLLVLALLVWYYFKSDDFNSAQRWATAGILGGGIGNIIDRIFRPDGVVDFISVKFYGFLGFSYWPTFNMADSSVVICCLLLFTTILVSAKKPKDEAAK